MKNKTFIFFYALSLIGIIVLSFYPLYMGVRVIYDMAVSGTVLSANYPKYIIPYTPVSLAVIFGLSVMPLAIKFFRKYAQLIATSVSLAVFFVSELLLEQKVIITDTVKTTLESWQMYMCYVPPESTVTRTYRAIDVLIGDYSPTFKLHFYIIALILVITILGCFYGFANVILSERKERIKPLVLQSVSSVLFLALCIFACFTAFFRTGELTVSPLSASLMAIFFIIFGVTAGIFTGSFLIGKSKALSCIFPGAIASLLVLVMYIAQMFLLSGNVYRLGSGFFFRGLGALVLAPCDIMIILISGLITFVVMLFCQRRA